MRKFTKQETSVTSFGFYSLNHNQNEMSLKGPQNPIHPLGWQEDQMGKSTNDTEDKEDAWMDAKAYLFRDKWGQLNLLNLFLHF